MTALVGELPQQRAEDVGQQRRPLVAALRAHLDARTQAWSCPGHKGAGLDEDLLGVVGPGAYSADVWLETGAYAAALREAETLAAAAWGAQRAWLLSGGSSAGNRALLLAGTGPGRPVVVARDAHTSTLAGLVASGARPVWVTPRTHPVHGLPLGVDPARVDAALAASPQARLVLVVSPGYHGACSDLGAIAAVTHARGAALVVDEAWGAHLPFAAHAPAAALASGADAVITSAHKQLGALSQGAILLAQGERLDLGRLAQAVRMTETTSPYLPLMASIDSARSVAATQGTTLLARAAAVATTLRKELQNLTALDVLDAETLGLPPDRHDGLRIVVDVSRSGLTGGQVDTALRAVGFAVEGADARRVMFVVGPGDAADHHQAGAHISALITALTELLTSTAQLGLHPLPPLPCLTPNPAAQALTPREAWFADIHTVPAHHAADRICAEVITPYPPGVPALLPGEIITTDALTRLQTLLHAGVSLHGATDPTLATLRVVA
jgi:arginine/lysine/ornithine decarboxylase